MLIKKYSIVNYLNEKRLHFVFLVLVIFSFSTILTSCVSGKKTDNFRNYYVNSDSIIKEGYELYYLEKASWTSTDFIKKKYGPFSEINNYLGYMSYKDQDTIFSIYYKMIDSNIKVFETYKFNNTSILESMMVVSETRDMNNIEKYMLKCLNQIEKLQDTIPFYFTPPNAGKNLVFLREGNQFRLFILTGTFEHDVIPFGNDFVFKFDSEGESMIGGQIHPTVVFDKDSSKVPEKYGSYDPVKQTKNSNGVYEVCDHKHFGSTPDFITSADICNILLYGKSKSYIVWSRKFISIFTPNDKEPLSIFTRKFVEQQVKRKR